MEETIRYPKKKMYLPVMVGNEKLSQMQPLSRISSTGIPAELNVKSSTSITTSTDTMLTTLLSTAKDFSNSYSFVDSPAR